LDLGYVGTSVCISCHPLDVSGKCELIFLHEDRVDCDSEDTCCASCHLECNENTTSTTLPPTTTTTAVALTTTSTSTAGSPHCAIETSYGEFSEKTGFLRYVRDNILSKTPEGKKVIECYYRWSPVLVKLMEEDDDFKREVEELLDCIVDMCAGEGE